MPTSNSAPRAVGDTSETRLDAIERTLEITPDGDGMFYSLHHVGREDVAWLITQLRSALPSLLDTCRNGAALIAAERARQVSDEGWTPAHDDQHDEGELAIAGAIYAWPKPRPQFVKQSWPWHRDWWKPTVPDREPVSCGCRSVGECVHGWASTEQAKRAARIRDLAKAGALIAAEIDRLQRVSSPASAERASK